MTEHIREAGIRHVSEISCNQKQLVEKAFYMRAQSYLAYVKAQLLTDTIFEVEGQRKELQRINQALERKQRELTTEIAHRQAIFDNSSAGILLIDPNLRFCDANSHCLQMLGYAREELMGQKAAFLHASEPGQTEDFQTFLQRLRQRPVAEARDRFECPLRPRQGAVIWCDISGRVIDSGATDPEIVCVCVDITERRRAEAERIQAREAAEAANRAKSAFLANMSHELRTPLNAMLGYAQILQRDPKIDERQRAGIDTIQRSGDYLLTLINDVLDLAKIESGHFELFASPCNLSLLLRGITELFRMRAEQKGLCFQFREAPGLPETVEVDEKRLRQVLMNLLSNAVKFTDQGGIWLNADWEAGRLHLEIGDTGIGIAPAHLPELFQPFRQGGAAHYRAQGTGLGLAISKNLVEQMKGQIRVETEPGRGSRFLLEIPLRVLHSAPKVASPAATVVPAVVTGYRRRDKNPAPLRILIVDDVADNRAMLRDLLVPLGFEILEAASGQEAIAEVRRHNPDLVLMDLVLPDIDGLETTRRIHALPGRTHPRIVAVSASVFPIDHARCLAAGCQDHLPKPMVIESLLHLLERHLPLHWCQAEATAKPLPKAAAMVEEPGRADAILAQHREALLRLVQRGKILELHERLDALCAPLADSGVLGEMREAAHRFDLRRIRQLLEQTAGD